MYATHFSPLNFYLFRREVGGGGGGRKTAVEHLISTDKGSLHSTCLNPKNDPKISWLRFKNTCFPQIKFLWRKLVSVKIMWKLLFVSFLIKLKTNKTKIKLLFQIKLSKGHNHWKSKSVAHLHANKVKATKRMWTRSFSTSAKRYAK